MEAAREIVAFSSLIMMIAGAGMTLMTGIGAFMAGSILVGGIILLILVVTSSDEPA